MGVRLTQISQHVQTARGTVPRRDNNRALPARGCRWQALLMFTIEHEFDSTVITLVDEGKPHLTEDVIINAFSECVTIEQFDPRTHSTHRITLSPEQLQDLAAALDLPEGVYRLVLDKSR